MPHNVRTSIATDPNGKITGYGISIEAMLEHGGQDEIRACIESSLDMIRQAIQEQLIAAIGHASTPAAPPASATVSTTKSETPAAPQVPPPYRAPTSAEEAEHRFFTRYAEIVGGESWLDVRAYLNTRSPKPTTIEGWINAAEAVRDQHHAEQYMASNDAEPQQEPSPAPKPAARRSARRAA